MIKLLSSVFIKGKLSVEQLRLRYGVLCGAVGIFFNICLFALKLTAGMISGSVAITADAFNNLSDAGSSIVSILGFKLSSEKPDIRHPFGHGRIEYIAGFIVSALVIIMGVELLQSSIDRILHPQETDYTDLALIILGCSILVKLYMFFYNRKYGKKLSSTALSATAIDSLSDTTATSAVLICALLSRAFDWQIDGYCGCAVALFILYSGVSSAKSTIDPLLGQPPEKELIDKIKKIVMCRPEIKGMHDLIVHNYGPGRFMISLHAEVSTDENIIEMHDIIDNIERELKDVLGCDAVIHMDPIASDDETSIRLKSIVKDIIAQIDNTITVHDFRIVKGPTHTNLIFDAVLPFGFKVGDREFCSQVMSLVSQADPSLYCVINVDRDYSK
ncbi:MAG TPA: cation diffusion facilitator family transporter [Bacillota bacterium]|nr:cation diffusion facilitator family transporter [Bacillota bacterium]